jgi:tetratricopeptide (TPR) repeat protein
LLGLSIQLHPNPAASAAWVCNLGLGLERAGQLGAALCSFRQAASLDRGYAEALVRFGRRRCQEEGPAAGFEAFQLAAEADPACVTAWFHLGVAALVKQSPETAYEAFRRAADLDPLCYEAWNNLGDLEIARGRMEEAVHCYRRSIAANPAYVPARYNLGIALQNDGRTEEAAREYEDLLKIDPEHADTLNNLGAVRLGQNRLDEAIQNLTRALQSNPDHVDACWNLGLARLALGDFQKGWAGYEARLRQPGFPARSFQAPRWSGEPAEGKRIFVWAEQGLGDTIQFMRYLPLLWEMGAEVVFEVQDRLAPLFGDLAVPRGGEAAGVDFHSPLLSLPRFFPGIPAVWRPGCFPSPSPANRERKRIGICWGANVNHSKARHRSVPLRTLLPLAGAAGCEFVSLQGGPQRSELEEIAGEWKIGTPERPDGSVADLAGIIAGLDLVISVDTMVAHLAATIGVSTWTLLPYAADWRWQLGREDSPWYPAMRLFRQREPGGWPEVAAQVSDALREWRKNS